KTAYNAEPGGVATDLPIVVLVDKGTASASEIITGALQDYNRDKVVGEQTFVKDSVTQIYRLSDGSAMNIVVARWLTPDGHLLEDKGITPDVEVSAGQDLQIGQPDHDVQLQSAIQLLESGQ